MIAAGRPLWRCSCSTHWVRLALYLPDDEFSIHSYDDGGQLLGAIRRSKVHPFRAISCIANQVWAPVPGNDFSVSAVPSTFRTET